MKTYLEIQVPISYDANWFDELRCKFNDVNVNWQKGFYHITMAFCDETPSVDLCPILEKHLSKVVSPELCFDHLDVFETHPGMFFIFLGVSNIPSYFVSLVENIRQDLKGAGCVMHKDFKLHVTLGRLKDPDANIISIKQLLNQISIPPTCLKLSDVEYKVMGSRDIIYKTSLKREFYRLFL